MEETAAAFFARLDVAGAPRDLIALGGRLDVETLVAAYRAGCFPWPATGPYEEPLDRDARRLARHGEVPVLPGTDDAAPLWPFPSATAGRHHTGGPQLRGLCPRSGKWPGASRWGGGGRDSARLVPLASW